MAELHSNLYFKHPDAVMHRLLRELFAIGCLNEPMQAAGPEEHAQKFVALCASINPAKGRALALETLQVCREEYYGEFGCESLHSVAGYHVAHLVQGGLGDQLTGAMVEFLYALCPGVHCQARGQGDDDPWEFWFKFDNGTLQRADDEPYNDEEEDDEIWNGIYRWWHSSMPAQIREGFLNDGLNRQYVVFTGVFTEGRREELEDMAREHGASVQGAINGKTTLLVAGEKPGTAKIDQARAAGVPIITLAELYALVE